MANFAIMRAKKLKGMGNVASSLSHCFRERETPNANPELTPNNEHMALNGVKIDSTDKAMGALRNRLPERRRKDAVLAVEYMMTASPEWWKTASTEQRKEFFTESVGWLTDKYGANNLIAATVHMDEKTPHLSAYVVPRTSDGRLSAKEYIGNKSKMSADQDTYAKRVAGLGLERGIKHSKATHTRLQTHYGALAQKPLGHLALRPEAVEPQTLSKGIFTKQVETSNQVAERVTKEVQDAYSSTIEIASTALQERRRRQELTDTAIEQQKRLEKLQEPFKGLSKDQLANVLKMAKGMQLENEAAREQQRQSRTRSTPGHSR
jgi:hypothetical protein